jgi:hypothetical protein
MLDHVACSTKAMRILIFGSHSNPGYTVPVLITVGVLILSPSKTQINGSRKSYIWGNDCPVILVKGVLFTVAPNPAVQFPMAATSSSYLQHTPLFPILYSDWKHT